MAARKKRQSILIINQEPEMASLLEELLSGEGYTTVAAVGIDAAVRLLTSIKVDLVICDHMGIKSRSSDRWPILEMYKALVDPGTPFIVLTTSPEALAQSAAELGVADIIEKPFDLNNLLRRVGKAIAGRAGGPRPRGAGEE